MLLKIKYIFWGEKKIVVGLIRDILSTTSSDYNHIGSCSEPASASPLAPLAAALYLLV